MSSSPRVAVVTPLRGRLEHVVNQRRFLRAVAPGALHVLAAVDMPDLRTDLDRAGVGGDDVGVVEVADHPLGMPTAQARNAGAAEAWRSGADLVVFLDVDCAPLPGFVEALTAAHAHLHEKGQQAVLNAPVTYLAQDARLDAETPTTARRLVVAHPARPAPAPGEVRVNDDHHLLWSLAFALDADTWHETGGFDERYVGYGAEDTDFGQRVRRAGRRMAWVGGANALHQWHPSANPPVHHLTDIVRNANLYRDRWGVWPMEGWLRSFAVDGLVEWTETSLRALR